MEQYNKSMIRRIQNHLIDRHWHTCTEGHDC
jgi:hypothetical protein